MIKEYRKILYSDVSKIDLPLTKKTWQERSMRTAEARISVEPLTTFTVLRRAKDISLDMFGLLVVIATPFPPSSSRLRTVISFISRSLQIPFAISALETVPARTRRSWARSSATSDGPERHPLTIVVRKGVTLRTDKGTFARSGCKPDPRWESALTQLDERPTKPLSRPSLRLAKDKSQAGETAFRINRHVISRYLPPNFTNPFLYMQSDVQDLTQLESFSKMVSFP